MLDLTHTLRSLTFIQGLSREALRWLEDLALVTDALHEDDELTFQLRIWCEGHDSDAYADEVLAEALDSLGRNDEYETLRRIVAVVVEIQNELAYVRDGRVPGRST